MTKENRPRSSKMDSAPQDGEEDDPTNMTEEELQLRLRALDSQLAAKNAELQSLKMLAHHVIWNTEENKFILSKINKPPFVVATVNQKWDDDQEQENADNEEENDDSSGEKAESKGTRRTIVRTSTRRTVYLEDPGLIPSESLQPGDEVCVNRDSGVIIKSVPKDFDAKVKMMEVVERPMDRYSDIGGLDEQIRELREAIVVPLLRNDLLTKMGVTAPRGVLLYGPPGTGKTLLARACAAETSATFLRLSATALVQHYVGEGARLVREAFALARHRAPTIIFIDELDAVGGKRFDSDKAGDREVQRTMLELLNQLDGFSPTDAIKVIAATNRLDVLDPALLRSGRLDRKIEVPEPNEHARLQVLQVHARKMALENDINLESIAQQADGLSAAALYAVCAEAALSAMRRNASAVSHEDFLAGLAEVQARPSNNPVPYA